MRATVNVVIDLPVDLEGMMKKVDRLTSDLIDRQIWRASFVDRDQRDGTPAFFSLTIHGDVKEENE